ncbi:TfuA-like protein [Sinorhizobium numidicum]|uniref:TfuA-like protein n=1 Tax=Sinorhizobium numidicum TaxID=680248 RepID=A0ABY8CM47_9HYPH|nr:TfuA-like protein [Sinorhizobium numidicum]WEX73773.1 TfuA-like protein [Sinorhizobium numidicum]WEX79758.1 TfuA-like protein [Sinorhizobium numidicum]
MKVVFVGPTIPDAVQMAGEPFVIRPPAMQGDILRAVRGGATAIGLIDGNFEYAAPVWHKEILFALSEGAEVFGAASMGALRAAECAAFGMIGVGEIYRQYAAGEIVDDSDVALLHAPKELRYAPLTIPLVNVRATLLGLTRQLSLAATDAERIEQSATALFYKERTWPAIVACARLARDCDKAALTAKLRAQYVDQKRADALELLDALRGRPCQRRAPNREWEFHSTSLWKTLLGQREASG